MHQSLPRGQYEVIVADDGADDDTRQCVESFIAARHDNCPVVRYVPVTGRHGPAAARNSGWRTAASPVIAFTDDDCLPDSDWLAESLRVFDSDAEATAVVGRIEVPLPPVPTDYERDVANLETAEFVTANCFCRREFLASIGGFDERFRTAWREDSDLHFTLLREGRRIVRCESAVVVHPVRPAPWGTGLRHERKHVFDALLFRKHPELFRQRIPGPPLDYYLIVGSFFVAVCGLVMGWMTAIAGGTAAWAVLTIGLILRRLKAKVLTATHVTEIAATSVVVPFVSLFWRYVGAVRFRVAML